VLSYYYYVKVDKDQRGGKKRPACLLQHHVHKSQLSQGVRLLKRKVDVYEKMLADAGIDIPNIFKKEVESDVTDMTDVLEVSSEEEDD